MQLFIELASQSAVDRFVDELRKRGLACEKSGESVLVSFPRFADDRELRKALGALIDFTLRHRSAVLVARWRGGVECWEGRERVFAIVVKDAGGSILERWSDPAEALFYRLSRLVKNRVAKLVELRASEALGLRHSRVVLHDGRWASMEVGYLRLGLLRYPLELWISNSDVLSVLPIELLVEEVVEEVRRELGSDGLSVEDLVELDALLGRVSNVVRIPPAKLAKSLVGSGAESANYVLASPPPEYPRVIYDVEEAIRAAKNGNLLLFLFVETPENRLYLPIARFGSPTPFTASGERFRSGRLLA